MLSDNFDDADHSGAQEMTGKGDTQKGYIVFRRMRRFKGTVFGLLLYQFACKKD